MLNQVPNQEPNGSTCLHLNELECHSEKKTLMTFPERQIFFRIFNCEYVFMIVIEKEICIVRFNIIYCEIFGLLHLRGHLRTQRIELIFVQNCGQECCVGVFF